MSCDELLSFFQVMRENNSSHEIDFRRKDSYPGFRMNSCSEKESKDIFNVVFGSYGYRVEWSLIPYGKRKEYHNTIVKYAHEYNKSKENIHIFHTS